MSDNERILGGNALEKNRGNEGKGRAKGVPNKTTKAVKEALQEAFDKLGGVTALATWAKNEPTEFYKLWAKMLPTEVKAKVETVGDTPIGKVQIEVISANAKDSSD
jgi:hypothetical protein